MEMTAGCTKKRSRDVDWFSVAGGVFDGLPNPALLERCVKTILALLTVRPSMDVDCEKLGLKMFDFTGVILL
jgi:hypothetical protein